jgi:hypothetical protein
MRNSMYRYARLLHVHNIDRNDYTCFHDDMQIRGSEGQSGSSNNGEPVLLDKVL